MEKIIIERECIAVNPEGGSLKTRIGLLLPVHANGIWECPLFFGEITENKRSAFGADSWQAVVLGMQMMHMELQTLQWIGWRFKWFNGESDSLGELLPKA